MVQASLLEPLLVQKPEEDVKKKQDGNDDRGIDMAVHVEIKSVSPSLKEVENVQPKESNKGEDSDCIESPKSTCKQGTLQEGATTEQEYPQPLFIRLYHWLEAHSALELLCSWFAPHQEEQRQDQGVMTAKGKVRTTKRVEPTSEMENNPQGRKEGLLSAVDVSALRCLWILFQLLWPAVLMALDCFSTLALMAPSAFTFWLVAKVIRGNILNKFGPWDFAPSLFWILLFLLNETDFGAVCNVILLLALVLAFLLVSILGPRKLWEMYLGETWEALVIKLSGKMDSLNRLMMKYLDEEDEEDKETARDEEEGSSDMGHLDHLEELSRKGQLKKPTWVMAGLIFLVVWQLCVLFYFQFVTLAKYQDAYTTVEKFNWLNYDRNYQSVQFQIPAFFKTPIPSLASRTSFR